MSPRGELGAEGKEWAQAATYHLPRLPVVQRRAVYAALEELSRALAPSCDATARLAPDHPPGCWWCHFAWDAVALGTALGATRVGRADRG